MKQQYGTKRRNNIRIVSDLQSLANRRHAVAASRYFKTGKGEYGEGDLFIGLRVPQQRTIAKKYIGLPLTDIVRLLHSPIHEYRQTALYIMTYQWKRADSHQRQLLYDAYLQNTAHINNWDLVDCSAPTIVGGYLIDTKEKRKLLYTLAVSRSLWERRIAVLSTLAFIRDRDFADAFAVAELLLSDTEDLIHKAVGWMLREIGKKDPAAEEAFLKKHCRTMPRTMLRYAIEKFPSAKRAMYLSRT